MYIGIDIGGTKTKAALVNENAVVNKVCIPTNKDSAQFFDMLFGVIDGLLVPEVEGIGIGIAGMVEGGKLLSAFNLGLDNLDIAEAVQAKYNLPCKIMNDAACFAIAEGFLGQTENLVYLTLGTGINVGVINGGRLFPGANSASLEYGQTTLFDKTVEGCVSGKALLKAAADAGLQCDTPEEAFQKSVVIREKFLFSLETVLVNICNTYRPQKIFIGGGLAPMVAPHIGRLGTALSTKNYGYRNAPAVSVEVSAVAADGGVLGAAMLMQI